MAFYWDHDHERSSNLWFKSQISSLAITVLNNSLFTSFSHSMCLLIAQILTARFPFKASKWPSALTVSAFFIIPVQLIVVSLHKSLHTQSPSAVSRSSCCPAPEVTNSHALAQWSILSTTRKPFFELQLTNEATYGIPCGVGCEEMGEIWGCSDDQKCCAGSLLTWYCYSQGCIRRTEERELPSCVANQTVLHQQASVAEHASPPPSRSLLPDLRISMAPPSGRVSIATGSDSSLRWWLLPNFSSTSSDFPTHPLFCASDSTPVCWRMLLLEQNLHS